MVYSIRLLFLFTFRLGAWKNTPDVDTNILCPLQQGRTNSSELNGRAEDSLALLNGNFLFADLKAYIFADPSSSNTPQESMQSLMRAFQAPDETTIPLIGVMSEADQHVVSQEEDSIEDFWGVVLAVAPLDSSFFLGQSPLAMAENSTETADLDEIRDIMMQSRCIEPPHQDLTDSESLAKDAVQNMQRRQKILKEKFSLEQQVIQRRVDEMKANFQDHIGLFFSLKCAI